MFKGTSKFRRRVLEYIYFARVMIRERSYMVFNSKAPKFGADHPREAINDPAGKSALECLFEYESKGVLHPCREARKLMWLMAGKFSRDWHISEWASGMKERIITAWELFTDGVPVPTIHAAQKGAGFKVLSDFEAWKPVVKRLDDYRAWKVAHA